MYLSKVISRWRIAAVSTLALALALAGTALTLTSPAPAVAQPPRADLCAEVSFDAGFDGDALVTAVAIALAESRCNPGATGYSYPDECVQSIDRGLYQIGSCGHPEVDNGCAYDPQCNAAAAFRISSHGTNWSAWRATYHSGIYLDFVPEAQAAVGRLLPLRPLCYAVSGDWDGNGSDTLGAACKDGLEYRWTLRNSNSGGGSDIDRNYGNSDACLPVTGDWDGDGRDTIGVACKDGLTIRWSLTNTFQGHSYPAFGFGNANSCWPVTGDWDGDGTDTIGAACRGEGNAIRWHRRNANSSGGAHQSSYGPVSACRPVTGDWNGDGTDTVGAACRDGITIRWSLVNAFEGSPSYPVFGYGNATSCQPVTGDWNGTDTDTIGGACEGHALDWALRNSHSAGGTDHTAQFGNGRTYQPVRGWGGPNWPAWPHN